MKQAHVCSCCIACVRQYDAGCDSAHSLEHKGLTKDDASLLAAVLQFAHGLQFLRFVGVCWCVETNSSRALANEPTRMK